ncbi:MAG: YidC/Oxa1 family membrane protein insertase [Acidimicrobiales bacterium]
MVSLVPFLGIENSLFRTVGQIFHPLFEGIADVLAYIYGLVPNYALAIAILTVLIMALLTPLTVKSTRSMQAMQGLQPEMQKLRQKYKGAQNREQLNKEMMGLYKEHGVSPTGGCLPMFLQMPALVVLYDVIEGLANKVSRGGVLASGAHCAKALCATPRYIPHHSAMYQNLVATPGVMKSFGMNFAAKPLTHHGAWYDYIPYLAFVGVAVALQYFQMAQMTKRNKKNPNATTTPPQMQKMQRFMPLIFAYIYFIVPTGVSIYMIVSSAIRVATQGLIFRYGMKDRPGERRIGEGRRAGPKGLLGRATAALAPAAVRQEAGNGGARPAGNGGARPAGGGRSAGASRPTGPRPAGGAAGGTRGGGGARSGGSGGSGGSGQGKRAQGSAPATNGAGKPASKTGNRSPRGGATGGNTAGGTDPKAHPRSKSKRARKAR